MNALNPIRPRLPRLNRDVDGIVGQRGRVGVLQVNGLARSRTVDDEIQQIITKVGDGLPLDDNTVRLNIDKVKSRCGRQSDVWGTVNVGYAGVVHNEAAVVGGIEVEGHHKLARTCGHLLIQHVAQVA